MLLNKAKNKVKALIVTGLLAAISVVLLGFSVMVPLAGLPALRLSFFEIPIIIAGILYGPIAGALCGITSDLLGFLLFPKGPFFPGFTVSAALWGVIPGILFMINKSGKIKFNYNLLNSISILLIAAGVIGVLFSKGVLTLENNILYFYNKKLPTFYIILYLLVVLAFVVIPILFSKGKLNGKYSLDKLTFIVTISYIIISLGLNTLWLSIMFNKGFIIFLPGRVIAALAVIPIHSVILYTLSKTFKYIED